MVKMITKAHRDKSSSG